MSNLKFCPNCNQTGENAELKAAFAATGTKYKKEDVINFNKGFLWGIAPKNGEEFVLCPFCKSKVIDSGITSDDFLVLEEASNCNRQFLEAMIDLKEKDIIEYELKMSQFRNQVKQQETLEQESKAQKPNSNQITCPYCKSTNTKKITATSKAVNIALFGIFGNKRKYQWHCNKCGSDF